jgi:hypothetical protein
MGVRLPRHLQIIQGGRTTLHLVSTPTRATLLRAGVTIWAAISLTTSSACSAPCGPGDCPSRVCVKGACAEASCSDGVMNGSETGVDCGGGCSGCPPGAACIRSSDCAAGTNQMAPCIGRVCGAAVCAPGYADCNGDSSDGCEVRTDDDPEHCGACDEPCSPRQASGVCAAGTCAVDTCTSRFGDCNGSSADGCEADLTSSHLHCGTCGSPCPAFSFCSSGTCQCQSGRTPCGNICVNLASNTAHCGACDNACAPGELCGNSICACPTGQKLCNGTCLNIMVNNYNCGDCGVVCATGGWCYYGQCLCPTSESVCDGACTKMLTDKANCGTCGNACAVAEVCIYGTCRPDPEWANWPVPPPGPPPSNYVISNSIVTDAVTGLVWQRGFSSTQHTWTSAQNYCATLTVDGQTGWRVPTMIELTSIVHYLVAKPHIDLTAFPGTPADGFWSSSEVVGDPTRARFVNFATADSRLWPRSLLMSVRCVQ